LVTDIKKGHFQEGDGPSKTSLILQLKNLAQLSKALIDSVAHHAPPHPHEDHLREVDAVDAEEVLKCFGFPYLIKSYLTLHLPTVLLSRCHKPLEKGTNFLNFENTTFHPECFVCGSCSSPVSEKEFLLIDHRPICHNCSPSCGKCGLPITKNGIHVLRKYFHSSCFLCAGCKSVINNTSRFLHH